MTLPPKVLRIVAASPGDVKAERDVLGEVAEELNRGIAAVFGLRLEITRWETDSFPGFHAMGRQGLIDANLRIEGCDLLVGIFWKRFGTPVNGMDSGTEHEFRVAYKSWKTTGKPQIMLYFNQKPYMPVSKTDTDQQGKVLEFRDAFPEEGLWWKYKGKVEFEKAIRNHLTQFILQRATLESAETRSGAVEPETLIDAGSLRKPSRPGGEVARRPLHFIWIVDCSASMNDGGKIQALNASLQEVVPTLQAVARENPNSQLLMRVLSFSDGAQWHAAVPAPIEDFRWQDLHAGGGTDAGAALAMVADQLKIPPMSERSLPPVLVLLLDGAPTDDFDEGLRRLDKEPWGKKSVRIGIAIGSEADKEALKKFMGGNDRQPLEMHNASQLVKYMRWASTSVVGFSPLPPDITIPSPGEQDVDAW